MLQKFGSNLSFKLDGNSVILMNSVHRRSYMAGDRLRRSRRARGGLGFALARERCRRGFSLLPWPPYKAPTPSSLPFPLALFSRRRCSTPSSSHRRPSAIAVSTKRAPAPPYPCASSQPTNSASLSRELELHRLLPRGRQLLRRARFAAARAPRCIFVPGFG